MIVYKINKIAKAEEKMITYFFPEGLSWMLTYEDNEKLFFSTLSPNHDLLESESLKRNPLEKTHETKLLSLLK